jgi:hypothetical protein
MSHAIRLFLGCKYLNSQWDASPFFTNVNLKQVWVRAICSRRQTTISLLCSSHFRSYELARGLKKWKQSGLWAPRACLPNAGRTAILWVWLHTRNVLGNVQEMFGVTLHLWIGDITIPILCSRKLVHRGLKTIEAKFCFLIPRPLPRYSLDMPLNEFAPSFHISCDFTYQNFPNSS